MPTMTLIADLEDMGHKTQGEFEGAYANRKGSIIPADFPEIFPMTKLTHLNAEGAAHMVDVSDKTESSRSASAEAWLTMKPETLGRVLAGQLKKGDVFATARIAGIQAAKKCADLIPLCHPLMLGAVSVDFESDEAAGRLRVITRCRIKGQTGVEMEALTAASIAALTIYDMAKAVEKGISIGPVRLLEKSGGKSGDFKAFP